MSKNNKILSIVGIVLGACAIALGLLELIVLGLVFGVAGVILSLVAANKAKTNEEPSQLAKIGIIVSALGVVTCIVMLVLYIINEIGKDGMFKGAIDAVPYDK